MWSTAFACLSEADRASPLDAPDLDLLADAAHFVGRDVGRDADADEYAARSFRAWVKQQQPRRAARRAAWLGLRLLLRGEEVQAAAWFARAREILSGAAGGPDPEQGLLLIPVGLAHLRDSEPEAALDTFGEVAALGERFDEPDLAAMGQLGQGQALVAMGRISEAMTRPTKPCSCTTATCCQEPAASVRRSRRVRGRLRPAPGTPVTSALNRCV